MFHQEDSKNSRVKEYDSAEFVDAAMNGDVASVIQMLDKGMHPDDQGPKGWTALRMAAVRNEYEVAFVLLNRGAGVDATNYTGKTALMMACAYGNHQMVSLLLFYGADPDKMSCGGRTALMMAASEGHSRVVGTLLDASIHIDLHKTDRSGKAALDMAIEYGHDAIAKMLEAAGAVRHKAGFGGCKKGFVHDVVFPGVFHEN